MKSAPDAWLKKVSQLVEERGTTPVGKGKSRAFDGFLLTLNTNGNYVSVRQFGGSGLLERSDSQFLWPM